MKIYNEEFIQKVFDVVDWNFIAVNKKGTLLGWNEKPRINNTIDQYWSGLGTVIVDNVDLNGMDWKDSLRVRKWVPMDGMLCFVPETWSCTKYTTVLFIKDSELMFNLLKLGLLFKEKEEAILCAEKMLDAVKKG